MGTPPRGARWQRGANPRRPRRGRGLLRRRHGLL